MVHGSWLKGHGSCQKARGSRLMAHGQKKFGAGPPGPGPSELYGSKFSRRYGYCLGLSRPDTAYGRHEPTSAQPWTDRCGRFMHCCPEGRPPDWLGRPPEADANALNEKIWHALGRQTDAIASALAILVHTQRSVCKCWNTVPLTVCLFSSRRGTRLLMKLVVVPPMLT